MEFLVWTLGRARRDVANYQPDLRAVTSKSVELVRRPFWQELNPAQVNCREHPASGGHCGRVRARLGS